MTLAQHWLIAGQTRQYIAGLMMDAQPPGSLYWQRAAAMQRSGFKIMEAARMGDLDAARREALGADA